MQAVRDGQGRRVRTRGVTLTLVTSLALALGLMAAPSALAELYEANSADDVAGDLNCGDGDCTLRAAIIAANADTDLDAIDLDVNYTLADQGLGPEFGEDAAARGDLDITEDLSINIGDHTIDAADLDRVFHILNGAEVWIGTGQPDLGVIQNGRIGEAGCDQGGAIKVEDPSRLNLSRLTVQNSEAEYDDCGDARGGGIFVAGRLDLDTVRVTNNKALAGTPAMPKVSEGGGIWAATGSTLNVFRSTIDRNVAGGGGEGRPGEGGGIRSEATTTIVASTFGLNTAGGGHADASGAGGALYFKDSPSASLTNTTVSGNTAGGGGASGLGGNLFSRAGGVSIDYSTIANGVAVNGEGGNLESDADDIKPHRSIITAGTTPGNGAAEANCGAQNGGTFTTQGFNLESLDTCSLAAISNDIVNTDPQLGPLAGNGGLSDTHALLAGSLAIDSIPQADCGLTSDQRGQTRPGGPFHLPSAANDFTPGFRCDIGAFEVQLPAPPPGPSPPGFCQGVQANVTGTGEEDELRGTAGPDVITGLGGNDIIRGLGGRDRICGDSGQDIVRGGGGRDTIFGLSGADKLSGEAGRDLLQGGGGQDLLRGGRGVDRLLGGSGFDTLIGGPGNDRCNAGPGGARKRLC